MGKRPQYENKERKSGNKLLRLVNRSIDVRKDDCKVLF